MKSEQLNWIDTAKGLGILAVVAGHIYGADISRIIFIFHMPLFFFISGYLFEIKNSTAHYLSEKSIRLLIPYISFLICIYTPIAIIEIINNQAGTHTLLRPIIGGRALTGPTGVFWFVTCLFATQQIINYSLNNLSLKTLSAIMFSFFILSHINSILAPEFWLPLNLNVVLAACPLFFIGHIFRKSGMQKPMALSYAGAACSLIILALGYDNTYDMKFSKYGIPFITILSAISIIFITIKTSEIASSLPLIKQITASCGKASMTIMFMHQPIQFTLKNIEPLSGETARFLIATCIGILIHHILQLHRYSRALFLGSSTDFRSLTSRLKHNHT